MALAEPPADSLLMILPVGEMLRRAARRAYRLDFWLRKGIHGRPVETERFLCDEATAAILFRADEVLRWCTASGHKVGRGMVEMASLQIAKMLFPEEEIVG